MAEGANESEMRNLVGVLSISLICLLLGCARLQQTVTSPDGKMIAEILQSQSAAATDANTTYIKLRDKGGSAPDSVLEGTYYDAKIRISWVDSKTLTVECDKCADYQTRIQEQNWHGISIQYQMRASVR
jgi:hypothetical protein